MTDDIIIENEKFFRQVNTLLSIIKHKKYESFSNHLSTLKPVC